MIAPLLRDFFPLLAFMGQHTASQVRIHNIKEMTIIVSQSQLKTPPVRALSVSAREGPETVMVGDANAV
jgi:hypothetical protein